MTKQKKQKNIAVYPETIPLALWEEGPVFWDVRLPEELPVSQQPPVRRDGDISEDHGTPHLAALGSGPDMGRLRREVIEHALKYSASWETIACDVRATGEFDYLEDSETAVVANGLEETLAALRETNAEIDRRFGALQDEDERLLRKLQDPPRRVLVVVPDLDALSLFSDDFGMEFDRQKSEVLEVLLRIALLGAYPGVHLFLSGATFSGIGGKLLYHLRPRLVLSGAEEKEAHALLGVRGWLIKKPEPPEAGQMLIERRYVPGAAGMYCVLARLPE